MQTKLLEVRDEGTCIPVLAIQTSSETTVQKKYFQRCGYTDTHVLLVTLQSPNAKCDPYDWNDRTRRAAHLYIEDNWNLLKPGDVVDVRVTMGLAKEPVASEIMVDD